MVRGRLGAGQDRFRADSGAGKRLPVAGEGRPGMAECGKGWTGSG